MVLLSDHIRIFFLFIFENSCWQAICDEHRAVVHLRGSGPLARRRLKFTF